MIELAGVQEIDIAENDMAVPHLQTQSYNKITSPKALSIRSDAK